MGDEIVCPHCCETQQYTGDPLGEDERVDEDCVHCGKQFVLIQRVFYSLSVYKIESCPRCIHEGIDEDICRGCIGGDKFLSPLDWKESEANKLANPPSKKRGEDE